MYSAQTKYRMKLARENLERQVENARLFRRNKISVAVGAILGTTPALDRALGIDPAVRAVMK